MHTRTNKLPYEMRWMNLNLTTLETRRIMNGIEAIDWKLLFSKAPYMMEQEVT